MARKKKGRLVNGILVLDKPGGISSNKALQKIKRLYQAQKAGHTGSLDPLATGVLPICLGEATKVSHYLLDADKRYRAKCILGAVTTTGDSDGEIIDTRPVPALNKNQILDLLAAFEGEQDQTPPMFSALKYNGRPLYEYARKGIVVERKSRRITLFEVKLLDFSITDIAPDNPAFIEIEVHCSKGTYIRTLCEDIGKTIGCGAYISALRRIDSGPFSLAQALTIEQLYEQFSPDDVVNEAQQKQMDRLLLPTETAIEQFPRFDLNEQQFKQIQHGMTLEIIPAAISENYRLYFDNTLIALAILDENKHLKPKRLLFL
ncbi:MAG: tRNA pseudouridine(55) synthase TruB [gamma proteobacterium symbiont of Bathyaustriella thionipta]|nr:tRNA pseudouridine(55) synthase TruB [gamma proteobacterium symbiont of Bathyaustriella thionipta]MCU7949933.1 tRNA pseudouridine(55) synthase TruB [gamma proteobacterium symbiont of Bathyaustriella thionipta]MCU7954707.1 tRNA pseudouridine(55) synthase TruB [gamma proteobacterium symbiont of Bathyaustriella thionipta]MCU7956508.1 tRNA pseudouridine(55) synthase TruB [gamma proteobacterium symbiont of Bathyaustriella thionipta]MCU7966589.1 tRNA pseudouridine(55) synthase TruB [gamma proteoba